MTMFLRASVIAGLACGAISLGGVAMAQDTAAPAAPTTDAPAMPDHVDAAAAYASARNQLGVLNYCKDKGWIAAEPITVQEKMIAMLPTGDSTAGDAAEAKGKTGMVSAMGTEMTLADGAQKQSTTEEALCKQMETMLNELGAQLPG